MMNIKSFKIPGRSPLRSEVKKVDHLRPNEINRMYQLMALYYRDVSNSDFIDDLLAKDEVILLRERDGDAIMGFSTLKYFKLQGAQRAAVGLFSGDTVVDEKYWGCGALQLAFLVQMIKLKVKNLNADVYWFLISKGYKTYLLMANNFPVHYPRYETATLPAFEGKMAEVYASLYPDSYDQNRGLIRNSHLSYCLKKGIAAPNADLIARNPRVRFFVEKNQNWEAGDELACIATVDHRVLTQYIVKESQKLLRKPALLLGLSSQKIKEASL